MAHTPGPLTIKKGNYICKDDRAIGIAFNLRITEFGQSILPGRDNARLWAAAPNLLAACKLARKLLEIRGVDVLFPEDVIVIDRAIAKAEGNIPDEN